MTDSVRTNDVVRLETTGHVALVTLNRPEAMNAVNAEMASQLGAALDAADDDDVVRAVVLAGAGRAFCAGMDLKAFASGDAVALHGPDHLGFAGIARHPIDKPIIAAVNGFALGGGLEIALAADIIVADEHAEFALPEVTRGLFAAAGGVLRLAQQLPPRIASELALTGRRFTAHEALDWGLINRIAPAGTSLAVAHEFAAQVTANAPLAVAATKRLLRRSLTQNSWEGESWQWNRAEIANVFGSADAREGMTAFAEKRAPRWTGS